MVRAKKNQAPAPEVKAPEVPQDDVLQLIVKCLEPKATSADVTRLCKLKDQLGTINWDSSESLEMKAKLVACFESRVFYKTAQGINFLALVFTLHPLLVAPINEMLKRCILAFPAPLITGCAQVLFKAWSIASGGQRLLLEQSVMDWMRKALFTSVKTAERVRFLLSEFHSTTRTAPIDELLSRYYGPILFRHTKVANWEVRFNAIALVCAAFPVMPPDRTAIEFEEKLTSQFRVLKDAMEDPNESVRKCAIVGTGRILRDFWEVLTIEQIAMVLDTIIEKCAKDKKSWKTRVCAIDAVSLIVDNPLSHGVLSEVFASSSYGKNLFNDDSPQVCLRFCEFLVKLTKFRTMDITSMIPHGMLFGRLAVEHTKSLHGSPVIHAEIAQIIASVISPSLFVSSVEDQVVRCERMAETIPQGFLALTSHLSHHDQVDKVRLGVALYTRSVSLIAKGDERKIGLGRILLRAVTELFRATPFASVQGSEDVFDKDSDEGKLSAFIYRYVGDREVCKFFDFVIEKNIDVIVELCDLFSVLDGSRLPNLFNKLSALMAQGSVNDPRFDRVASSWGIYTQGDVVVVTKDHWSKILKIARSGELVTSSPVTDSICSVLASALKLDDTKTLIKHKEDMIAFIQAISGKLPNIKFLPRSVEMIQLCLSCLLKIHQHSMDDEKDKKISRTSSVPTASSSELSNVLHKLNIGFISSLAVGQLSPMPVPKRQRQDTNNAKETIEIALSVDEICELMYFYMSFLVIVSLLGGIPLRATKFEDLSKIFWNWTENDRNILKNDSVWERVEDVLVSCIESQQGAWASFALFEPAMTRVSVSEEIPRDSILESILNRVCDEFVHTTEFATFITKMCFVSNKRIMRILMQALKQKDDVPQSIINELATVAAIETTI